MTQETIDRIVKTQTIYWIAAVGFATGFSFFAKMIWTAKFPILIMLPLLMIGFAIGSVSAIRKELTPLISTGSNSVTKE